MKKSPAGSNKAANFLVDGFMRGVGQQTGGDVFGLGMKEEKKYEYDIKNTAKGAATALMDDFLR